MGTQIGSFFSFVLDIVIYDIFTTELESSMDLELVLAVWVDKLRIRVTPAGPCACNVFTCESLRLCRRLGFCRIFSSSKLFTSEQKIPVEFTSNPRNYREQPKTKGEQMS